MDFFRLDFGKPQIYKTILILVARPLKGGGGVPGHSEKIPFFEALENPPKKIPFTVDYRKSQTLDIVKEKIDTTTLQNIYYDTL